MKTLYLTIFLMTALFPYSGAQTSPVQIIRGTVTDAVTGHPVTGAHVILKDSQPLKGTATDEYGRFELRDVAVGRQTIEVSFLGYSSRTVSNLMVISGKELVVDISLEEAWNTLGEVTVKAAKRKSETINELAMVSARTFSVEETERFAGSLGDPARMVANYAGVMTQNDSRNDIIIRGNSPSGVLWRLEGVQTAIDIEEVGNKEHFFRINRAFLINMKAVTKIDILSKSRIKLTLDPPFSTEVMVSGPKSPEFRVWLEK